MSVLLECRRSLASPHADRGLFLIGVNTFLSKGHCGDIVTEIELIQRAEGEKGQQIANVANYQSMRNTAEGLGYLQKTARDRANVFAALMEAVKSYSLGQISHALYDVGGEYRRNM